MAEGPETEPPRFRDGLSHPAVNENVAILLLAA